MSLDIREDSAGPGSTSGSCNSRTEAGHTEAATAKSGAEENVSQRTGNEARQPLDAARGRQRISEIRSKRVSQNSRAAYTSSIVRFIQFVYRNNPFLLTTEFKDLIERDMEEGDPPLPSKRIIRTVLDENSVSWTGKKLPFMALFSLKH